MPDDIAPPVPPAHRTVRGAFRTTADLDRALARLAAVRPPAVAALVAADARAERWLAGTPSVPAAPTASASSGGPACALFVVLSGRVEDVALGYRQAWQAMELAGGAASAGGPLRSADDGAALDGAGHLVRVELPERDLTALLGWAAEVDAAAGGAGAWVRPGTGRGWVAVPPGDRADEALAWLGAQVRGRGGRVAIAAAAAVAS